MKNTKALKLIVLALSLILIIGMAVGFAASAEEELSVEITKKNLSYGEQVQILFAVDDTNAGGKEIEILYYLDDPQSNPDAKAYKGVSYDKGYTEGGVTYPAFFTAAFPAKDIDKQVYAQAHIVDTDVYSEIVRYSVVEYLNKRLYVDENVTDNQKGLCASLLSYGAYAQKVLYNEDDDPYNDRTQFVDEMVYVSIEGGTLDGKYSTGVYYVGDKIVPYKEGAVMWNVEFTDAEGNTGFASTGNDAYYTVAGRSFISLNTEAALKSYFDYYVGTSADGWDFDNDTEFTDTTSMESKNYIKRATWGVSHAGEDFDVTAKNEYIRIKALEDSNKVFEFGTGIGAKEGIFFRRHSVENAGYNARNLVFEAKINLNVADTAAQAVLDAGSNYIMNVSLSNSAITRPAGTINADYITGTEIGRIYTVKDENGKFHYYFNYANDNTAAVATSLAELKDGWNTITVEMDIKNQTGTCTAKVYVNGCQVGTMNFDGASDAALIASNAPNGVRVKYNSVVKNSYVYFDNIFCSYASQPAAE